MKTIWERENVRLSDILKSFFVPSNLILSDISILDGLNRKKIFTGSGKAAIKIVLDYLKLRGDLPDKNAEVFMSKWIGTAVHNTMHKTCFPTIALSKNIKGLLVYHQYGFPQDMDKIEDYCKKHHLFIIEDCANVYESYYKSRRLGSYGVASIFSLSKIFPCIHGGILATEDKDLIKFAGECLEKSNNAMSLFSNFAAFMFHKTRGAKINPFFQNLQELAYARIDTATRIRKASLNIVKKELVSNAIEKRKRNYLFLRDSFEKYDYFDHLEKEGVVPYVAPLITKESKLIEMKNKLTKAGIFTDLYHFDVNRNLLNPNFKKNIWVPVHQGLNLEDMEKICNIIKSVV